MSDWHIDGRDVFIQDWETDKDMSVEDAQNKLNRADAIQSLCIFEDNSTLHLLKLIADDLDTSLTSGSIRRARAGWLRRFIKAVANLEAGCE